MIACFLTNMLLMFFTQRTFRRKNLMFATSSYRHFVGSQSANFESEETKNVGVLLEGDSLRLLSDPPSDDETQKHTITSNLVDKEDKKSDKKRSVSQVSVAESSCRLFYFC